VSPILPVDSFVSMKDETTLGHQFGTGNLTRLLRRAGLFGDVRAMVQRLRQGIVDRRPPVALSGEVECDEVDVVAGHKGHPEAVKKKGGSGGGGG
jgi:hypothetical protein